MIYEIVKGTKSTILALLGMPVTCFVEQQGKDINYDKFLRNLNYVLYSIVENANIDKYDPKSNSFSVFSLGCMESSSIKRAENKPIFIIKRVEE